MRFPKRILSWGQHPSPRQRGLPPKGFSPHGTRPSRERGSMPLLRYGPNCTRNRAKRVAKSPTAADSRTDHVSDPSAWGVSAIRS